MSWLLLALGCAGEPEQTDPPETDPPTTPPTEFRSDPIPAELEGVWSSVALSAFDWYDSASRTWSTPPENIDTWWFLTDGYVSHARYEARDEGGCQHAAYLVESGTVWVEGDALTFHPDTDGVLISEDSCDPAGNFELPSDVGRQDYTWETRVIDAVDRLRLTTTGGVVLDYQAL